MSAVETIQQRVEFERAYAARSGVTVAWLHQHGRYAEPCYCGAWYCEGWVMGYAHDDALAENADRQGG